LREIDRRIEPLRIEHEKAVCLEVRPEYLKISTRVVAAIKETCDASEAEKKFYEDLRDSGVDAIASYLPRIVFHGDWKWDDPNGGVIHYWRKYITENYPELKGGAR
ncbi:MAG: hypothetical protein U1E51_21290, partial [Candidatus Binatia bacterium]|nr:hypothetical protein [Candidatus Binatia bacterium]